MAIRIGLLGCGNVGSVVLRLLGEQAADLAARVGEPLELAGVAVRRPKRHPDVPPDLLTTDAGSLVARPDVDVVVEVIGGIEPARSLLLQAMQGGKSVVTANKALLAEDGPGLHEAARDAKVDLYYEASVGGAIPLLRPLRESLAGDRIDRVFGIVNGTTNYVLASMHRSGASFGEALAEATSLGYAEADPTADIDGFDASSKAAILAGLAFHTRVSAGDVYREGIADVTPADVASAESMNYVIKLLAICERFGDGSIGARVHPAMIPADHPLAGVGDAFNAVYVEALAAGALMFYGRGAGGAPTASAVLGDVVAVARNRVLGGLGAGESSYAQLRIRPVGEISTCYHVSLDVADQPGVLAEVAGCFARRGVSISTMRQVGRDDDASLVIVTHTAPDASLAATVADIRGLAVVEDVRSVMRVEGGATRHG